MTDTNTPIGRLIPTDKSKLQPKTSSVIDPVASIPKAASSFESDLSSKLEQYGYTKTFYDKEVKLKQVHTAMLKNEPIVDTADRLGISPSEVASLRIELKEKLAKALKKEDPMQLVAESTAFYDTIIAEAMSVVERVKGQPYLKVNDMVRALEIALKARGGKDKFLVDVGILNNNLSSEHVEAQDEVNVQTTKLKNTIINIMAMSND